MEGWLGCWGGSFGNKVGGGCWGFGEGGRGDGGFLWARSLF